MAPKRYYSPQQMALAVEAVNKGFKLAEAAKHFNVPRATLHNKVTGKSPISCSMGPSTVLSKQEEDVLEGWIKEMADKHIPITKEELLDSVQRIIIDKNQETPFSSNRPGKKWFASFMKRHPLIADCIAQSASTPRETVTQEDVEKWFSEVEDDLKNRHLLDIVKHPERIFNMDESAIFLNPKPGRVLLRKGSKNVVVSGDGKENLTVLVTGNAAGVLAPTLVVYNYPKIPSSISETFPNDWAIGHSESGWMCASTFHEYITTVFNPWLSNNKIKKPVLLFLDGHKAHLTWHLSNFCSENGIEVVALNPTSTHIVQPIELAVFRPLKSSWREEVKNWKMRNLGQDVENHHFAPLFKTTIEKISAERVKNGFRAGGLYPFGPAYIDLSNIKCQNRQIVDSTNQSNFLKTLENKIETTLSKEKLKLFKDLYYKSHLELDKLLPVEDKSLYLVWANSKQIDVVNEELTSNPEYFLEVNISSTNNSPKENDWSHNTNECDPSTSLQTRVMFNEESTSSEVEANKTVPVAESHDSNVNGSSNEKQIYSNLSHYHHDPRSSSRIESLCYMNKSGPNSSNKGNLGHESLPDVDNGLQKCSDKIFIRPCAESNACNNIISPFKRDMYRPETDETTRNKKRKLKEKVPFTIAHSDPT